MTEAILTPNRWSRPQRSLDIVRAIVLHWYAHPKQTASGARGWWEARKDGGKGYGSAHIAIDDRETLLCVPLDEMAYHVGADSYSYFGYEHLCNYPNSCTIGVELAHDDWTGKPSLKVWEEAVRVVSDLCDRFRLPETMIVTHFDVTGARPHWPHSYPCHRWFVEQPGEMARFRAEIASARR